LAFHRETRARSESPAIAGLAIRLSTPARYGVAIVAAIIAIFVRLALDPVWGVTLPCRVLCEGMVVGLANHTLLMSRDGREIPIDDSAAPIRTSTRDVIGIVIICRDVIERRRSERERAALLESEQAARAAAEAAVRVRDEFLSIASHELRNPVNAVQLQLAGVLREMERSDDALTREWLGVRIGRAESQVRRLTRLIDNLLDVSRITAGAIALEPEDVDFLDIVRAAVDHFRDELKPNQVILRLPGEPMRGYWDPVRLDQVVSNLLSNAIKYGNGKPIELSLQGESDVVRLSIADHGIGIEPDQQRRLFRPFERAVSGRQYGGFGLGLWITRRVVEAMHGSIAVESRPSEGSTFVVLLPRRPLTLDSRPNWPEEEERAGWLDGFSSWTTMPDRERPWRMSSAMKGSTWSQWRVAAPRWISCAARRRLT